MMTKLFRSRLFRFLLILLIAGSLFYLSVYLRHKASNVEVTTNVYVVTKNLESKHQIAATDITTVEISALSEPSYAIKDKSLLINKFVMNPVSKGSFILSNNVSNIANFEGFSVPKGKMIYSLPLTIDQAAGWKIEIGQKVNLHYSPFQYGELEGQVPIAVSNAALFSSKMIQDAEVVDVMNEALISTKSSEFAGVPKYVVLMSTIEEASFITQAKDKGRFDILIKSLE